MVEGVETEIIMGSWRAEMATIGKNELTATEESQTLRSLRHLVASEVIQPS